MNSFSMLEDATLRSRIGRLRLEACDGALPAIQPDSVHGRINYREEPRMRLDRSGLSIGR